MGHIYTATAPAKCEHTTRRNAKIRTMAAGDTMTIPKSEAVAWRKAAGAVGIRVTIKSISETESRITRFY